MTSMINRRDTIFALGCAAAAGGAIWLRPNNYQRLMPDQTLAAAIPEQFGDWMIDRGLGVVLPPSKGSLADRLYDEIMARAYYQPGNLALSPVMCLMSFGARQSDALQLHRPETCYPAVGFQVSGYRQTRLALTESVIMPTVEMTATIGPRVEDVLYWTRVGEDLPSDSAEQRKMRLRAAMAGNVGDGVLVRMSSVRRKADQPAFGVLRAFAVQMLQAVDPRVRRGLIGTELAGGFRAEP